MDDNERLIRKNNIAAYLFLAGAIISSLLLLFMVFVFALIFGSINAIFQSVGGHADNGFYAGDIWQLYLFGLLVVTGIVAQFAAFVMIKIRSRYGRVAGIASCVLSLVLFTPVVLLLIYPFAFLVGNEGKYFYKYLIKK